MINSEYLVIFGQVHTPTHFASFASHVYSASRAITTTNKEGGWKKKCTICDFFSSGFLHCRYLQAGTHSTAALCILNGVIEREPNLQIPKECKTLNRSRNKETFFTRFVQQQKFCITRGMNDMKSQAN